MERQSQQPATQPTRLVEPNRQIEQRKRAVESREPISESRKRTTAKSSQSIDRLTRTVGRTRQTARTVANNLNQQSGRKQRLGDRITSFGQALINLANQIKRLATAKLRQAFVQRLQADAAQEQMIRTYDTTDFHTKQKIALADETEWYHQQINQVIADITSQLNNEQIKQQITSDLVRQQQNLDTKIAELSQLQRQITHRESILKVWVNLGLPSLVGLVLTFVAIWFVFIR